MTYTSNDVKKRIKEREERKPSLSSSTSKVSANDVKRRMAERELGRMSSSLSSASETIGKAYGGWNTQEDMDKFSSSLTDIGKSITDYTNRYGDYLNDDQKKVFSSYTDAIGGLNDLKSLYGYYQNADAFNAAMEKQKNAPEKVYAFDKYKSLMGNKDFGEKSTYIKDAKANSDKAFNSKIEEAEYNYINSGTRSNLGSLALESLAGFDADARDAYSKMTDEEKSVYNYIFNTEGGEAASKFLGDIRNDLAKRSYDEASLKLKEWQDNHGLIGNALLSAGATVGQLAVSANPFGTTNNTVGDLIESIHNPNYSPYSGISGAYNIASEVNGNISQRMANATNSDIANFGLQIGADAATMYLPNRIGQRLFGGAYNIVMGTGAYINGYKEAIERGLSQEEAVKTAGAAGAIEFLTEQIGMEWALGKVKSNSAIKDLVKQFLAEGSEEVVGNIANALYDQFANKGKAELKAEYQEYIDRGFTEKEAKSMVAKDFAFQTFEQFLAAGLSAGIEGGANEIRTANIGANVDRELYSKAMQNFSQESDVYKDYANLVSQYGENLENANGFNANWKIGRGLADAYNAKIEDLDLGENTADNTNKLNATRDMLDAALKGKAKKKSKVFQTGETTKDADNNEFKIKDIYTKDDDTVILTTDDRELNANDVTLSVNDMNIAEVAKDIPNAEVRQAFIQSYDGQDVPTYYNAVNLVRQFAKDGIGIKEAVETIDESILNRDQIKRIYDAASLSEAETSAANNRAIKNTTTQWDGQFKKQGKFNAEAIKDVNLSKSEKRIVQMLQLFSKLGMNITVIADSSRESDNGMVVKSDNNTITINIKARYSAEFRAKDANGQYAVNTFAHESTHWMENILGDEFETFKDVLKSWAGETKWNDFMSKEKVNNPGIKSIKALESEVVARMCEDMLNDTTTVDRILAVADESKIKKIVARIRQWFAEIKKDIEELMKGYSSDAPEAQFLAESLEQFKAVQDMWVEMFQKALIQNQMVVKNAIAAVKNDNQKKAIDLVGKVDDVQNSIKLDDDLGKKTMLHNNKYLVVDQRVLSESIGRRKDIARKLRLLEAFLPEDIEGNTLTKNDSYGKSIEHALICVRSLVNNWFIDKVAQEVGRPLSAEEQIVASEILAGKVGDQRECQYCYVAADRRSYKAAFKNYYDSYVSLFNKTNNNKASYKKELDYINKNYSKISAEAKNKNKVTYIDEKGKEKSTQSRKLYFESIKNEVPGFLEFLAGRDATKNMLDRYIHIITDGVNGHMALDAKAFATETDRHALLNDSDMGWYIKDATSYAKSATKAKLTSRTIKIGKKKYDLEYVAYNGNILNMSEPVVNYLNGEYGLRMYSDSDYVPAFLLEDMQMITDASVRGLKMLAYTKDLGFVRVFAPSKININISTYGVLDNEVESDSKFQKAKSEYLANPNDDTRAAYINLLDKHVVKDAMQGAEWEDAKKLVKEFENVGVVFVATNDDLVEWAMAQDWIHVVIPYHTVFAGLETKEYFNYTNYKDSQGDVKKADWNNSYLKSIPPTIHENDYKKYKKALEENHLTARFPQWEKNPNYMKLVNETRLSYLKTEPVVPVFGWSDAYEELARIPLEGKYGYLQGYNTEEEQRNVLEAEKKDAVKLIKSGRITKEDVEKFLVSKTHGESDANDGGILKSAKVDTPLDLASRFVSIAEDFDAYNTMDEVADIGNEIDKIADDIANGEIGYVVDTLENVLADDDYESVWEDAQSLLNDIQGVKKSNPTENGDIRYSNKIEDITADQYKEMKNHFGTTGNFNTAGYLLKDGYMLDFSGRHWGDTNSRFRQVDHRDIQEVLPGGNPGAMINMIGNGNVRLYPEIGGINLSQPLTKQQRAVLGKYITYGPGKTEGIVVDIDEVGGDTIKSFTFRPGVDTRTVMRAIDNYFANPEQTSDLMRFHTASDDEVLFSSKVEKDASLLTEDDFRNLLEDVYNGVFDYGTYIPMRAKTPQIFIDVVDAHSEGNVKVLSLPMISTVEHVYQNMEEDDGGSYGNRRPHGLSVDDVVEISKRMSDPQYIVFQKNGRYAEVVSFTNKKHKKVVVSIDIATKKKNYKHSSFMNGYAPGYYNIIVTEFEPDSLESYLNNNTVIYDKKNALNHGGSGSIISVTHDSAFFEDNDIIGGENGQDDSLKSSKVGYHAGDLGKAEPLYNMSSGRDTGHFGTGTYFVGDEAAINIGGYKDRPHEKVDFSKYNLFKVYSSQDGYDLHKFLKGVNSFYNRDEDAYKTEREWDAARTALENGLDPWDEEDRMPDGVALEAARRLFGEYEVANTLARHADEELWIGSDGTLATPDDHELTDLEIVDRIDVNEALWDLLKDNRYAPRWVTNYEDWNDDFWKAAYILGTTEDNLRKFIAEIGEELKGVNRNSDRAKTMDSASTMLMKKLGYEGIDVRGTNLDNTAYGSVIYDLKGEDLQRKNEIGTARFSKKVDMDAADILKQKNRLEKENAKLKEDVARLAKRFALDSKRTKGLVLEDRHLESAAKVILKDANSTYDKKELVSDLRNFYGYILEHSQELYWDEVMGRAYEVAAKVMNKAKPQKIVDDYYKQIISDIRNARIKLTPEQIQEAKNAYGDEWRREFLGRILIANDGRSLDSYWGEWAEAYPNIFNADENPGDQIIRLSEIYDSAKELSTTIQNFNDAESIRQMAIEVYNKFWTVDTITTTADKYTAEIKRLNYEHRKAISELKKSSSDEIKKLKVDSANDKREAVEAQRKADMEYYHEMLERVRKQKNERMAEYKEYVKKQKIDQKEAAERKAYVNKITDVSKTLMDWMFANDGKNQRVIPDVLKVPVKQLLSAINYDSKRALGMMGGEYKGVPTKKDISMRKALKAIYDMVNKAQGAEEDDSNYSNISYLFPENYLERVESLLNRANDIAVESGTDEYVLNQMTSEELDSLYTLVKTMKEIVTKFNKLLANSNAHSVDYVAQKDMVSNKELGDKKSWRATKIIKKFFEWENALPIYGFRHLGEGASEMFTEFQDGWDKFAFNVKKITDFTEELFKDIDITKWEEEVRTFDILVLPTKSEEKRGGKAHREEVKMTVAQMMSIYCLSKRANAKNHFSGKGIQIASFKDGKYDVTQTKNVRLSDDALKTIINGLSEDQIRIADELQNFMNTTCSDWGNEISMKRYGIKGFTEENYFPVTVDVNTLATDPKDNTRSLYRLLNLSFTKPINPKATAEMTIGSIFDVFTAHSSDMAKYNALSLPVLDMMKYYNYKEADNEGNVFTMKKSIEQAHGAEAKTFINQFLGDVNGNQESGRGETIMKKLTRGYKTAAVAANLQVALLQPISILRATAVMDNKYLAKGMVSVGKIKHGMNMCKKYSGIAVWKGMSMFDTNITKGLDAKIKHNETAVDKVIEGSMKLAELADTVTWGSIWNACEAEVKDKTDLSGEEFNKAVAKRFREVIYLTQVVDSTMTRTSIMRSQSLATQWATSFMSEPSVSMNVWQNAVINFAQDKRKSGVKEAFKKNGKTFLRATEAYLLTTIAEAVVRGAIGKLRDDEDDETLIEKMWNEFFQNLNILNNIPIARDVVSTFQGYDVNRMDVETFKNLYYAYTGFQKNGVNYKSVYRLLQSVSQLTGIPISSAMRELELMKNAWNLIVSEIYPNLTF